MRLIRILLAVIVGVALIVFAVVNRQPVDVSFWPLPVSFEAPLFVVALVFLLLGVLAGGIAAWARAAHTRGENRRLRRRAEALETQVEALRRQQAEAENRRGAAPAAPPPPRAATDGVTRPPAIGYRGEPAGATPPYLLTGGGRA